MLYNCVIDLLCNVKRYFYSDLIEDEYDGLTLEGLKRYRKKSPNFQN